MEYVSPTIKFIVLVLKCKQSLQILMNWLVSLKKVVLIFSNIVFFLVYIESFCFDHWCFVLVIIKSIHIEIVFYNVHFSME